MTTPPQIEGEGNRAYAAFDAYVQMGDNRSTGKVAKQLGKSRQLICRWCSKHRWQARIAAQRLREVEARIASEELAMAKRSEITEESRARVAEKAFRVGARMIDVADDIMEQHPVSSARLLATGVQTVALVGGAASGYSVPAPAVEIVQTFYDAEGNEIAAPSSVSNLDFDTLENLAARLHEKPQALPCGGWDPAHADASPSTPIAEEPAPAAEPEPEPEPPGVPVPARAMATPTSDGRGADGTGVPSTPQRGMVRIFGV
jgi:hypothetical protein